VAIKKILEKAHVLIRGAVYVGIVIVIIVAGLYFTVITKEVWVQCAILMLFLNGFVLLHNLCDKSPR
jgi:hypothetical protein